MTEEFFSRKYISIPKKTTTKPNRTLMSLASPIFKKNAPGMEPRITRMHKGTQTFKSMPFRSDQAMKRLEG